MLSPYRVLDLSDDRGIFCGFMLGELGAEVICVEPPAGSQARKRGPFAGGEPSPEHSLFWWAYARNHRSVVLDPESHNDRDALLELIASADVLIESRMPGEMARHGLGYETLAQLNPALVYVSITAFGQNGPKAKWSGTDLTVLAAGGVLWLNGEADRAPVRTSVPQAFTHAASEAAAATLVALHERQTSGVGQHVDVSAQQAVTLATQSDIVAAAVGAKEISRSLSNPRPGALKLRMIYPASDGHVSITHLFGPSIGPASARLMQVVCEEGHCSETLRDKDWVRMNTLIINGEESVESFEEAKGAIADWTASHTKTELQALAMRHKLLIAPVATMQDVTLSHQLAERAFFQPLPHPDRGDARQLGPFVRLNRQPPVPARMAPKIGEHHDRILSSPRKPPANRASHPSPKNGLPLAGVKILDFMWAIAGPAATRMLADYGAEVIRIESRSRPDAIRGARPFVGGRPAAENSTLFHSTNTSKRMLGLNLAKPESREVVLDLVRWADVVCESFSQGTIERLGFGYDVLREIKPDIIMLSTCLMGQTGPLAKFAGYGNLAAGISGFHEMTGWADRNASGPFGAYTDYVAPKFSATTLLAALEHRRRTGEGHYIDLSQAEASLHYLAPALLDTLVNGRVPSRVGNRDEHHAPHGCYRVAGDQQWLAVAVADDSHWQKFCQALFQEQEPNPLLADPRFTTARGRHENADLLDAAISAVTETRDGGELEAQLQSVGIACHRVLDSPGAVSDIQLQARGHFVKLTGADDSYTVVEDTRSRLSRTPARIRGGIPTFGRDNQEILGQLLGYSDQKITSLQKAGVLEQPL